MYPKQGVYLRKKFCSPKYFRKFRDNFDISLNVRVPNYNKNRWKQLSSLLPLTRKVSLVTQFITSIILTYITMLCSHFSMFIDCYS